MSLPQVLAGTGQDDKRECSTERQLSWECVMEKMEFMECFKGGARERGSPRYEGSLGTSIKGDFKASICAVSHGVFVFLEGKNEAFVFRPLCGLFINVTRAI